TGAYALETYLYNSRLQPAILELGTTTIGRQSAYYCLVYDYYGNPPTSCPSKAPTGSSGNNGNVMSYWYKDGVMTSPPPYYSHAANYNYDKVNRLSSATAYTLTNGATLWSQTYPNFDAFGNRSCTGACYGLTWNSQTNQLETITVNGNQSGFSYDAAG